MALPITIVSDGFDWAAFFTGIAQTAIGGFLGFALGLIAAHIQARQQANDESSERWQATVDVVQRLMFCAHQNLESLGALKTGQLASLRPEIKPMKDAFEAAFADNAKIPQLIATSEGSAHFYEGIPTLAQMPCPTFQELSSAAKHMPGLNIFVFRAASFFDDANERIRNRNSLIMGHAAENGGAGMSVERVLFYASMLCDEGRNVIENVEFSMTCFQLVYEQAGLFLQRKAKVTVLCPPMLGQTSAALPPADTFPALRQLIVNFG